MIATATELGDQLSERIATLVGIETSLVAWDTPFLELGLSSMQAVELSDDLERWTGLSVSPTVAFDYPTIETLVEALAQEMQRERDVLLLEPAQAEPQ